MSNRDCSNSRRKGIRINAEGYRMEVVLNGICFVLWVLHPTIEMVAIRIREPLFIDVYFCSVCVVDSVVRQWRH